MVTDIPSFCHLNQPKISESYGKSECNRNDLISLASGALINAELQLTRLASDYNHISAANMLDT